MYEIITSTSNTKYKQIKLLLQKKYRVESECFTVEGIKSVQDAMNSDWEIVNIVVTQTFYETENFDYDNHKIIYVQDELFSGLCDTKTPQGILAVLKMKNESEIPHNTGCCVFCDHVTDPGNIGTIIRTADAAGMDCVLLSEGCAELYNPKTVRASMGSFFHMKLFTNISVKQVHTMQENGFRLLCGALHEDAVQYTKTDLSEKILITLGNEANGVTKDILDIADECIKIPIEGKAESLNVAIAGAVLMYESLRQRKSQKSL